MFQRLEWPTNVEWRARECLYLWTTPILYRLEHRARMGAHLVGTWTTQKARFRDPLGLTLAVTLLRIQYEYNVLILNTAWQSLAFGQSWFELSRN